MRSNSKAQIELYQIFLRTSRGRSESEINSNKFHLNDIAATEKGKFNGIVDMSIQEIIQKLLVEI